MPVPPVQQTVLEATTSAFIHHRFNGFINVEQHRTIIVSDPHGKLRCGSKGNNGVGVALQQQRGLNHDEMNAVCSWLQSLQPTAQHWHLSAVWDDVRRAVQGLHPVVDQPAALNSG